MSLRLTLVLGNMNHDSLLETSYDGKEYDNVHIIQGKFGEQEYLEELEEAVERAKGDWNGCDHFGEQYMDPDTERMIWPHVNGIDQVRRWTYLLT